MSDRSTWINRALLSIAICAVLGMLVSVGAIQILDNLAIALIGAFVVAFAGIGWVILAIVMAILAVKTWRLRRR